jgi:hypothetical protein
VASHLSFSHHAGDFNDGKDGDGCPLQSAPILIGFFLGSMIERNCKRLTIAIRGDCKTLQAREACPPRGPMRLQTQQ